MSKICESIETCKKCASENSCKNGFVRSKQRYKCKDCGLNFNHGDRRNLRAKEQNIKNIALQFYQLGLGFRAIGRFLKVSNVSVLDWVKKAEDLSPNIESPLSVKAIELDVVLLSKKKRKVWLSLAICRHSKQILASEH